MTIKELSDNELTLLSSLIKQNKDKLKEIITGGKTLIPMRRHSFRYKALLSLSSRTLVSGAAIYSAG